MTSAPAVFSPTPRHKVYYNSRVCSMHTKHMCVHSSLCVRVWVRAQILRALATTILNYFVLADLNQSLPGYSP